jgi:hypothetical protein
MLKTHRGPGRTVPESDWRPMPVQVFVRADEDGNATHLRFRLENGDDHVAPVRPENVALRALAEELLRATPPRGRCSRWFG